MIVTNLFEVPGRKYELLGLVKGSVVQSKHLGKDLLAGFKTMVGGEIKAYTEMLNEARHIATTRMINEATGMGADAVLCVRYSSASIMDGSAEVLAYGTAVKFIT